MLLSSLFKVSNSDISVTEFRGEIKDEVAKYKELLKKKGVSIPIFLNEDIDLLSIDIKKLFDVISTERFDKYESSYIADAITLSESYNGLDENDAYLIESLVLD